MAITRITRTGSTLASYPLLATVFVACLAFPTNGRGDGGVEFFEAKIRPALVNVNTSVIGRRPEIDLAALIDGAGRKATLDEARSGTRAVFFDAWVETPVYWRDHLPAEATLQGPAIVEQMDCTLVLEPGDVAVQDGDGNLVVTVGASS